MHHTWHYQCTLKDVVFVHLLFVLKFVEWMHQIQYDKAEILFLSFLKDSTTTMMTTWVENILANNCLVRQ